MSEPIETIQITAQYVNEPKIGKKMGSVKDTHGNYFYIWPNDLQKISPGQTFTVDYTRGNKDGMFFVKKVHLGPGVQQNPQAPIDAPPSGHPAAFDAPVPAGEQFVPELPVTEKDPTDENIFVTGNTQRIMGGLATHMDPESLVKWLPLVTNAAIKAWRGRGGT